MNGMLGDRLRMPVGHRSCLAVLALVLALGYPAAAPIASPDLTAVARAEEASGLCAAKLGPLRLAEDAIGDQDSPGGWSWVRCRYDDPRKSSADYAWIHVTWVEPGNPALEREPTWRYYCQTGDNRSAGRHDPDGWDKVDYSLVGERHIVAYWRATEEKARKPAGKLARRLHASYKDRAAPCPDTLAPGTPRTAQTVTVVLTGDRIDALSAGGGIGAVIGLEHDERSNLVVWGNGEVITSEYVGERGVVTEIGPMATGSDGERAVLVTVEVWPNGSDDVPPEPDLEPDAEPGAEPEAGVEPDAEPGAEPEAGVEPDAEPGPQVEPEPEPADAAQLGQALVDDLTSQLDAVATAGGGSIEIEAALVDRLAGLPVLTDKVSEVRLGDGKVVLIMPPDDEGNQPSPVEIYPLVVKGKVDIDLWTSFEGLPVPVLDSFLRALAPDLPRLIDEAKAAVNGAVEGKGLEVTDAAITPDGITIVVKERDD